MVFYNIQIYIFIYRYIYINIYKLIYLEIQIHTDSLSGNVHLWKSLFECLVQQGTEVQLRWKLPG